MSKVLELREKVRGVTRIHKMAEAMQIVAAAQLKTAQQRQRAVANYVKNYHRLAEKVNLEIKPAAAEVKNLVLIYALFSERGFCAGFNENLMKQLKGLVKDFESRGKGIQIIIIGNKGCEMSKEIGLPSVLERKMSERGPNFTQAAENALAAHKRYLAGEVESVYLLFNAFESILIQRPRLHLFLPLSAKTEPAKDVIFEPSAAAVRENAALNYIKIIFYDALMQNYLGEIASRLLTMRGAAENSKEMINALVIKLNKARQAMITSELSEIASSFEVLTEGE